MLCSFPASQSVNGGADEEVTVYYEGINEYLWYFHVLLLLHPNAYVIVLTGYGPSDSYQQGGRLSLGKSLS